MKMRLGYFSEIQWVLKNCKKYVGKCLKGGGGGGGMPPLPTFQLF